MTTGITGDRRVQLDQDLPAIAELDADSNPVSDLAVDALEEKQAGSHCVSAAPLVEDGVCRRRTATLPKLNVEASIAYQRDNLEAPDVLVLTMTKVKPGADLCVAIRKRGQVFDEDSAINLPANTENFAADEQGNYSIVLGGEWLEDHPFEPGMVIEVRQRMPDGTRESEGEVVPIADNNTGAPRLRRGQQNPPTRQLVVHPGDRIGVGPGALVARPVAPRLLNVDPGAISHAIEGDDIVIRGELDPFAFVGLRNFTSGKRTLQPIQADQDGKFEVRVPGEAQDAFVLGVADHTAGLHLQGTPNAFQFPNQPAVRLLTGLAGVKDSPALLIANPTLGIDGPTELRLPRLSAAGGKLICDRGVTPGALVTITNESSEPVSTFRTVASAKGSFILPADLKLGDHFRVDVENPQLRDEDLMTTARIKVVKGAKKAKSAELALDEDFGDAARVLSADKGAVKPATNVDAVESIEPLRQQLYTEVTGIEGAGHLGFNVTLRSNAHTRGGGNSQLREVSQTIDHENRKFIIEFDHVAVGGYLAHGEDADKPMGVKLRPDHNRGAYPQNFQHVVRGDWTLEIHQTGVGLLGSAKVKGDYKTRSYTTTSYDGRGGILPASSIPYKHHTSRTTQFEVSDFIQNS